MIDPKTGNVILPGSDIEFGRALTFSEFERLPLGSMLHEISRRGVIAVAYVHMEDAGGVPWTIQLVFVNGAPQEIGMAVVDKCFGISWDDWSEEKEIQRKRRHDEYLRQWLGRPPYSYEWGTVCSVYDSKGGGSWIITKYVQ